MTNLGGIFGAIGLISIFYLALRLILEAVTRQFRKQGKPTPRLLKKMYQFVTKTHRYAGFVALTAIVVHFVLQYIYYDYVPIAGIIAGLVLVIQSVLGMGLIRQPDKTRRSKMAKLHRVLGVLLVVAVLIHRISGSRMDAEL